MGTGSATTRLAQLSFLRCAAYREQSIERLPHSRHGHASQEQVTLRGMWESLRPWEMIPTRSSRRPPCNRLQFPAFPWRTLTIDRSFSRDGVPLLLCGEILTISDQPCCYYRHRTEYKNSNAFCSMGFFWQCHSRTNKCISDATT
jgi:hypothetical protein